MWAARETVAAVLNDQARACSSLGSPLYAFLLERAADDVGRAGPVWGLLRGHEGDPPGSALALRLMGAVHRLVLSGSAPDLARYYSAAPGAPQAGAWPSFVAVVEEHRDTLHDLIERPVQTNEVGRCAALLRGFLEVARRTALPVTLLEIGASAGLNLRWDHYRYTAPGDSWGPADSPVNIAGAFVGCPDLTPEDVEVLERRGCDPHPLDPSSAADSLTLRSYVWPDQPGRVRRLEAALDVARSVPAPVDRASAVDWLAARLDERPQDAATVVFHSIVVQYLTDEERTRLRSLLCETGRRTGAGAPLAWLRMEPAGSHAAVHLTMWPDGAEQLLATSGYHGSAVHWSALMSP